LEYENHEVPFMNKDLYLSPSLVAFQDLSELLSTVDEYIEAHSAAIANYEDRLGVVLRGASSETRQGSRPFEQAEVPIDLQNGGDPQPKMDKRKRPSSEGREEGWLVLEADETNLKVATGNSSSTAQKQTEALFKIIESLKARLASLDKARKLISSLPGQGFKPNQKIAVMFRDGIPRQIIPMNEIARPKRKFKYSEVFDIQVLT
jgi:hypothetical protein